MVLCVGSVRGFNSRSEHGPLSTEPSHSRPLNIQLRDCAEGIEALARDLEVPPFLARVFRSRGIREPKDLDLSLSGLEQPNGLPDIHRAAERLCVAIENQEHIAIVGDFDADGATATSLCVSFLKKVGCSQVSFHVPDRAGFGYGLSTAFCEHVLVQKPKVIVTVDNGVSSIDGIALAQAAGVDVIVTDHHLPPESLPNAFAIVNPALEQSKFEGSLAGVGVAFYLMWVVWRLLEKHGRFDGEDVQAFSITEWLDLVALGTVADLVPLDRNNRILVSQGLLRMKRGQTAPGIRALCAIAKRSLSTLSVRDLGFAVAPRLNAAGRIADMRTGVHCLLAQESKQARKLAVRLNEFNQARRSIQSDMTRIAQELVDKSDRDSPAYCLHHDSFNEGVVGLVASRVKEWTGRPVAAFANSQPASLRQIKGSMRSVDGVHIRDILVEIDSRYPYLIQSFGGHAMAAGLTIRSESLVRFQTVFQERVRIHLENTPPPGTWVTDGELETESLTEENARLIERFEPWGKGFEEPLFHGQFGIVVQRVLGGRHLKLVLERDGKTIEGIAFNRGALKSKEAILVYHLRLNRYGAQDTLQLDIQAIQPL